MDFGGFRWTNTYPRSYVRPEMRAEADGITSGDVRSYYDENTRLMLRLGEGTEGTIHRAIWGPGVGTVEEAVRYVEKLIGDRLEALSRDSSTPLRQIVDLGCGVCGSLCRISHRAGCPGLGITISDAQVAVARRLIERLGLSDTVRCIKGDFCSLPPDLAMSDMAYAIESFVHAPSASAFFSESAKLLRKGGLLAVCDDFATSESEQGAAGRWKGRFRRGWVLGSLITRSRADSLAHAAGFELAENVDLTPYLRVGRPRDVAISLLMRGFGWLPVRSRYWSMLYGGNALQVCRKRGWVKYYLAVWRKK